MTAKITGRLTASLTVLLAGIALAGPAQPSDAAAAAKAAPGHTTTAATSRTASLTNSGWNPVAVVKIDGALLEEYDTAFPDSHIERYREGAPEPYQAALQTAPAK